MEHTKKIPQRSEIPEKDRWATEDLYASDALWHADLEKLKAEGAKLARFAGRLCENADSLLEYLTEMEQLQLLSARLASYAMRKADEDTRVSTYQAMSGLFFTTLTALQSGIAFETPEIMALSDEQLDVFYATQPKLERFRRYLTDKRRLKAHTLSPAEEKLMAGVAEVADAPSDIFNLFSNADMKFPNATDSKGNSVPVTSGNFVMHQSSPDRELRRSAYEQMYDTLDAWKNTSAAILNAQVKQLKFKAQVRKYPSALDASLSRTNVPTDVYHNLIDAVHQNMDKMHRYVRLRKKLLGVDELHFYDVYTPLVGGVDRYISIEEAKATVYDALYPLGDKYRAILKEGFENRWIDVYENVGKRSGAYSSGSKVHPFVLLNHTGTLKSQFTLAHEMGHALHSYHSNKRQNPLDSSYVIFVAEVASTCNEALLMEYLLGKTTDKKERAFLINHFLEQFKGTLYRQTMFAEFERSINDMAAKGITLTADVLCREYKRLNEEYFGPDMVVDDRIAVEWARIPHFYYNFYVFQYATGYAAAIALSRKILSEGETAVQKYLNFLSSGCTKAPVELLKDAGVDMSSPEPVNQALELFGKLLDEMEALMED